MDWNRFNTFNESKEKAFEIFSNQIFKFYCEKNYKQDMNNFVVINGAGGDGGIEAYAKLSNNKIIAIQSKCFFNRIDSSEITQIRNSIKTAIKVRDNIQKYIVSIPRDLANKKKGVVNYERKKINDLFNEFKDTNIEFELWGEFELFDYIVKNNELTGVHKFWFDNSEIDFSTINRHFQLQKNGWLKDKYNKNLHVKTNINRQIELILGDEENKKEKIEKANGMIEIFKEYLLMFEKFMQIKNYDIRNKLEKIYNQQTKEIEEMIQHLLNIIKYLKNENIYLIDKTRSFNIDTAWFYNIEKDIMSMHYNKMKEYIEIIEDIDINQFLKQCEDEYFKRNILVIGDFGTGKTHSIVNQIEKELERKNVAILIRASDINSKSSWKEILSKALGLSNTWSEEEIFCALDLLANRNQYISDSSDSDIQINKKVLICFDGIDEYSDYGYWYEKQLEAEELIKTYRNFRFCFIGRRYAFKTIENLHSYKIVNFDYHPGFDMKEMFNKYMLHYNIKFTNSINIKTYLNNPIVLKNFSEINKNKTIDSLEGLKINLVDLFTIKLNKMNEEFLNNNVDINCKDVLNRSANIIANFLYSNNKICKKQIINLMNEDDELQLIEDTKKNKIIESLQKYGLLYVKIEEFELGIKKETYYKGMQPIIDYIMARKLSKEIINEKNKKIDIDVNPTVLKLCALILFEENQIFLPDVKNLDIDLFLLEEASWYAVVNANPLKTKTIKNRIYESILRNPNNMRKILNNIIIPCSRIPDHPLGSELLNDILIGYKNMASRDKIWSLPELLRNDKIKITQDVIINNENPNYFLNKDDKHTGLPLIYVWLLTGVNNMKLYFYRNQLMNWAILCPYEFVLLLDKIDSINDIQVIEQIYSVAMCLCYKIKDKDIINEIINIIEKSFFVGDKIKIYNFQIRTYIRDIAELALKLNVIKQNRIKKYLPPYNCEKVIKLDKKAAENGTRMSGYSAIDYDLARYVLCDHISYRFFEDYDYHNQEENEIKLQDVFSIEELLKNKKYFDNSKEYTDAVNELKKNNLQNKILLKYCNDDLLGDDENNEENIEDELIKCEKDIIISKKIELLKNEGKKIEKDDLSESEFIISAAYQYLIECGWNEDDFYGQDKIDSEIRSKYYHATHGSKSSVMSFVEKYIWCFRNEIMGYLADKLSMEKNNNLKFYNYIEIDDVLDPISEYEQNSNGKDKLQNAFIQENVFENIENLNYEEIGNWIKSEDLDINIEKWIYIKDKYWVLNRYDCFTNLRNNLEFTMWISSGIINKKDIKYLQDNLDNKQIYLYRIINDPESFSEYTNSDGSITPFEIINFDWNSVNESDFSNISLLDNTINRYKIHKTYESAFNVHTEFNEIHYKIPSKRIRNMLNINNNDGFEYKSDEEVVAVFEKNNKSWDDHHNILVADSKKIKEKINQNNETLVWFIRIDKDLNSLGREQYNKDIGRNSILIVCWFEKEKLNIKYIKE